MKMKRILNKYREFARYIDKDIKVKQDKEQWLSYVDKKLVCVPQLALEESDKHFMLSVKRALPKDQKELVDIIPEITWSFLHEIGHTQKGLGFLYYVKQDLASLLWKFKPTQWLGNIIYFRIKEEKQATKWATDYVTNNLEVVIKFTNELSKAYQSHFKSMGLEKC